MRCFTGGASRLLPRLTNPMTSRGWCASCRCLALVTMLTACMAFSLDRRIVDDDIHSGSVTSSRGRSLLHKHPDCTWGDCGGYNCDGSCDEPWNNAGCDHNCLGCEACPHLFPRAPPTPPSLPHGFGAPPAPPPPPPEMLTMWENGCGEDQRVHIKFSDLVGLSSMNYTQLQFDGCSVFVTQCYQIPDDPVSGSFYLNVISSSCGTADGIATFGYDNQASCEQLRTSLASATSLQFIFFAFALQTANNIPEQSIPINSCVQTTNLRLAEAGSPRGRPLDCYTVFAAGNATYLGTAQWQTELPGNTVEATCEGITISPSAPSVPPPVASPATPPVSSPSSPPSASPRPPADALHPPPPDPMPSSPSPPASMPPTPADPPSTTENSPAPDEPALTGGNSSDDSALVGGVVGGAVGGVALLVLAAFCVARARNKPAQDAVSASRGSGPNEVKCETVSAA